MEPTRVTVLLQPVSGVKAMWLVTGMPLELGPAQTSADFWVCAGRWADCKRYVMSCYWHMGTIIRKPQIWIFKAE